MFTGLSRQDSCMHSQASGLKIKAATTGFFTFIFTCSFWMPMRQISQLNLTVNARKMSIPVTGRGEKKSTPLILHPSSSQQNHSMGKRVLTATTVAINIFAAACDPAHNPKKSHTIPPRESHRCTPLPLLSGHHAVPLYPPQGFNHKLMSIYIFNK